MSSFQPLEVKAFANLLLDWADEMSVAVSPMKLQKLIYYCHADFLITNGAPLVAQEFEAWEYGPVIPSLFQEFKNCGAESIRQRAFRFNPLTASREIASPAELGPYLNSVRASFEIYGRLSAATLSRLSHSSDGPWSEALERFNRGRNMGKKISNNLIYSHHNFLKSDSVH